MDEKIDLAMEKVLGLIRVNMKEDEVQKVTQAALNMAHVKQIWASLGSRKKPSES